MSLFPKRIVFFFLSFLAAGLCLGQGLQPAMMAGAPAQPKVAEVKVKLDGPQRVEQSAVLAHVRLRAGMVYDQQLVDQSIRSLYETGLYDFVESQRETGAHGVVLTFSLVPKFRVSAVIFKGNKAYASERLQKQIETKAGGVLDPVQVSRDALKLTEYYEKHGYAKITIASDIERNEVNGTAVVSFSLSEGNHMVIRRVDFSGNEHLKADDLRKQLKTRTYAWWRSWFDDTGYLLKNQFELDLDALITHYKNNGFLDVEVPADKVAFEYPKPSAMHINITVLEGRQYKVGKISISGNTVFDTASLMPELRVKEGDIFSPAQIEQTTEALRDFYGQVGYLDTYVRAIRKANVDTGAIDVNFNVIESEKFFVESIVVQGNDKTQSTVVLRELALAPGDVFDLKRMRLSEARLRNTRYFDEVNIDPEPTNIPGRRNMRISLREGRTGMLTFGAGFSTVENLVAFAEFTQGNFDLFNGGNSFFDWFGGRNSFQGAGQKFRLRLALGTKTNMILLSFEEPWLFQRQLGFEWNGYRQESSYYSDFYDETRLGTSFFFRKRIWELIEGRVGYTVEDIGVSDVSQNAPMDIKKESGHRSVSKVTVNFLRDQRNSLMFPSNGTRFEIINELAGGPFFGQTNYYKLEGRAGWWTSLFGKDDTHVFQLIARGGSMMAYGGQTGIPYMERFFLGGSYNMRGYGYREVGPYQTDPNQSGEGEPLGGATFVYFSPEYTFKILEQVRLAVFYDFGYVNAGEWDFDSSNYSHNIGVGIRILVMGAPLRLDLGYPLNPNKYQSQSVQFNFSFGTAF